MPFGNKALQLSKTLFLQDPIDSSAFRKPFFVQRFTHGRTPPCQELKKKTSTKRNQTKVENHLSFFPLYFCVNFPTYLHAPGIRGVRGADRPTDKRICELSNPLVSAWVSKGHHLLGLTSIAYVDVDLQGID